MGGRQRRQGPRATEERGQRRRGARPTEWTQRRSRAATVERDRRWPRPRPRRRAAGTAAAARKRPGGGRSRRALDEPPHGCVRGWRPLERLASATTGSRARRRGPDDRRGPHRRRHVRGVAERLSKRRPERALGMPTSLGGARSRPPRPLVVLEGPGCQISAGIWRMNTVGPVMKTEARQCAAPAAGVSRPVQSSGPLCTGRLRGVPLRLRSPVGRGQAALNWWNEGCPRWPRWTESRDPPLYRPRATGCGLVSLPRPLFGVLLLRSTHPHFVHRRRAITAVLETHPVFLCRTSARHAHQFHRRVVPATPPPPLPLPPMTSSPPGSSVTLAAGGALPRRRPPRHDANPPPNLVSFPDGLRLDEASCTVLHQWVDQLVLSATGAALVVEALTVRRVPDGALPPRCRPTLYMTDVEDGAAAVVPLPLKEWQAPPAVTDDAEDTSLGDHELKQAEQAVVQTVDRPRRTGPSYRQGRTQLESSSPDRVRSTDERSDGAAAAAAGSRGGSPGLASAVLEPPRRGPGRPPKRPSTPVSDGGDGDTVAMTTTRPRTRARASSVDGDQGLSAAAIAAGGAAAGSRGATPGPAEASLVPHRRGPGRPPKRPRTPLPDNGSSSMAAATDVFASRGLARASSADGGHGRPTAATAAGGVAAGDRGSSPRPTEAAPVPRRRGPGRPPKRPPTPLPDGRGNGDTAAMDTAAPRTQVRASSIDGEQGRRAAAISGGAAAAGSRGETPGPAEASLVPHRRGPGRPPKRPRTPMPDGGGDGDMAAMDTAAPRTRARALSVDGDHGRPAAATAVRAAAAGRRSATPGPVETSIVPHRRGPGRPPKRPSTPMPDGGGDGDMAAMDTAAPRTRARALSVDGDHGRPAAATAVRAAAAGRRSATPGPAEASLMPHRRGLGRPPKRPRTPLPDNGNSRIAVAAHVPSPLRASAAGGLAVSSPPPSPVGAPSSASKTAKSPADGEHRPPIMRLSARATVYLEDGPVRVLRMDVPGVSLSHVRQVTVFKADLREMPGASTRRRLKRSALHTWEAEGEEGGEVLPAVPVDEGEPVEVSVRGRAGRKVTPRDPQLRQGCDDAAVVAEAPAVANRSDAVAVAQRWSTPPLRAAPPPVPARAPSPSPSPSPSARRPLSWSNTEEEVTLRRLAAEARQAAIEEAAADGGDDEEDDDTFWGRAYGADASDGEAGEAGTGWGPDDAVDDEVEEERGGNRNGGSHRPAEVALAAAQPPPSPTVAPTPTSLPSVATAVAFAPPSALHMPLVVAGPASLPDAVAAAAVPTFHVALPAHVQHGDTRRLPPHFPPPSDGAGPPLGRSPPPLPGLSVFGEPVPSPFPLFDDAVGLPPSAADGSWAESGLPLLPPVSDAWGDPFQMPPGGGASVLTSTVLRTGHGGVMGGFWGWLAVGASPPVRQIGRGGAGV